jgi:hypothetical protein
MQPMILGGQLPSAPPATAPSTRMRTNRKYPQTFEGGREKPAKDTQRGTTTRNRRLSDSRHNPLFVSNVHLASSTLDLV